MENEFIFVIISAVLWVIASVTMTIVGLVLQSKRQKMGTKEYDKWANAFHLIVYLWMVLGLLYASTFGAELMFKKLIVNL